jgi:MFS family permease
LLVQLSVLSAVSGVLAALAFAGHLHVWHIALGGSIAGTVWACEMAVRRRMISEVVRTDRVAGAIAFDSLTNSTSRVVGPLCGGALFEAIGPGGAYLLSAVLYLVALAAITGLEFRQDSRRLRFGRIPREIAEGIGVARATPAILGVVLVTIIMNAFAFCYSALIPAIGVGEFRVSPTLVGALAAAEPVGSIIVGSALAAGWLKVNGARSLLRGSFLMIGGVIGMAISPWYGTAFLCLLVGGLGMAVFTNMQTSLVVIEAPPASRSRVLGIVTMCIGTGPLGVLAIGALAERIGPTLAILIMTGIGLIGLTLVWRKLVSGPARALSGPGVSAAGIRSAPPLRPS